MLPADNDMDGWAEEAQKLRPGDLILYRCNEAEGVPAILGIVTIVRLNGFQLKPLFDPQLLELKGLFPHKVLTHIENFDPSA